MWVLTTLQLSVENHMMKVIEWHLHNNCKYCMKTACLVTAWHLTSAWWLFDYNIKTTLWLPNVYLPKVSLKLSDICPMTSRAQKLFDDCLTTAWCLPYDFWLPLDDCLRTPWRLTDNWPTIDKQPEDFFKSHFSKTLGKTKKRRFKACVATSSLKISYMLWKTFYKL